MKKGKMLLTIKKFSLMNYLDFIYCQPLLGCIEESKSKFRTLLSYYFKCLAKTLKDDDLENIVLQLEQKYGISTELPKNQFKSIAKFKTKKFFGAVDYYPLVINELNFLRDLEVSLERITSSELGDVEIQKIIDDGANKKRLYEKIVSSLSKSKPETLAAFKKFFKSENEYSQLANFNVAVCATMSAGKSTLVNALLGSDVLPTRNEATTAKITSVYDKDGLTSLKGICQKKNDEEFLFEVEEKNIDAWNSDSDVEHIYLQGDLDGIKNTDKIAVAVHDTPGTNNSQDKSHNKVTMDFLQNSDIDAIIYVANFEQLLTTDESHLLKEIEEKVLSKRNVPVIFVVNKVDSYDSEKESFDETMEKFVQAVETLGFKNFDVVPVAAKPARLFKMALKEKGKFFTESECDVFDSLFRKFTKRININEFCRNPAKEQDSQIYGDTEMDKIEIDGEKYEVQMLRQALLNTGLIALEKRIENIIINK